MVRQARQLPYLNFWIHYPILTKQGRLSTPIDFGCLKKSLITPLKWRKVYKSCQNCAIVPYHNNISRALPVSKWKFKYKREKESCEPFWWAALTGHGQSADFWKIAKMVLFDPCMKFEIFVGQMTSYEMIKSLVNFIPKASGRRRSNQD